MLSDPTWTRSFHNELGESFVYDPFGFWAFSLWRFCALIFLEGAYIFQFALSSQDQGMYDVMDKWALYGNFVEW